MRAWSFSVALALLAPSIASAQTWHAERAGIATWSGTLEGMLSAHVARIDLCTRGVRLRVTAPPERGQTTSAWASAVGAVVATNGDYFEGLEPTGPSRGNDQWWTHTPRVHHDALIAAGAHRLPRIVLTSLSTPALWLDAPTLIAPGESEVLAAREQVLRDGVAVQSPQIAHDGARHPRTAVGFSSDRRTLWLLVIDGRREDGDGATVEQLGAALRSLGATNGLKLDGGGSATLYVRGRGVINRPSDGRERVVANHLGVLVDPAGGVADGCVAHASAVRAPSRGAHGWAPTPCGVVALSIGAAAGSLIRTRRARRARTDTPSVSIRKRPMPRRPHERVRFGRAQPVLMARCPRWIGPRRWRSCRLERRRAQHARRTGLVLRPRGSWRCWASPSPRKHVRARFDTRPGSGTRCGHATVAEQHSAPSRTSAQGSIAMH